MTDDHPRTLPDLGLLALAGDPPSWIWAFTCPMPRCACRTAIVLSVGGDRAALLARGAPVREAWLRGDNYGCVAEAIAGGVAFAIDIDRGGVKPVFGDESLDLAANPAARAVVERMDGETLEEIARVWYLGKGRPDPEEQSRAATSKIALQTWQPGDPVEWEEAIEPLRRDIYAVADRSFEAVDLYHLPGDSERDEVIVDFAVLRPRGAPEPGSVRIDPTGAPHLEPEHERHREMLEKLWGAFCRRHPRYLERFARRRTIMHALADRVVAAAAPSPRRLPPAARAKKAQRKNARRARQKNR